MKRATPFLLLFAAWATVPAWGHGPFPCVGGTAGGYTCHRVDLAHHLSLAQIGGGNGSDIWGWTDPTNGREYALVGRTTGTAFVDVTDWDAPVYLGNLPSRANPSSWRDIKVYADHAFIVSDFNSGQSGLQVFDLAQLRTVVNPPVTFSSTATYDQFDNAHNIAINEDTGFAYVVGANSGSGTTNCSGGLHMLDLSNPLVPTFAGCFSSDGYTHDVQCVTYNGPDTDYFLREICFAANEDTLTIVDVTNKAAPVQLSRTGYAGRGYTHQGWLTEDQRWFLLDDEVDEQQQGHGTKTYFWDVENLEAPVMRFFYQAAVAASDHNVYTRGRYAFLANYRSGLRILDLAAIDSQVVSEIAFFDTFPASNNVGFDGAWSSYPYFDSGTVVVSDITNGLFVLRPQLCDPLGPPTLASAVAAGANTIDVGWGALQPGETVDVERAYGGCASPDPFEVVATGLTGTSWSDTNVSGQVAAAYRLIRRSEAGLCRSEAGVCFEATTTGACTAPPAFAGLLTATSGGAVCAVDLEWAPAAARCGGPARYDVHRSPTEPFTPSSGSLIVGNLASTNWRDYDVAPGQELSWLTRSRDLGNGSEDHNLVTQTLTVVGPLTDGSWASGAELGEPILDGATSGVEKHAGWHITSGFARTGERSWSSESFAATCLSLETPEITLTPGQASTFTLWSAWALEVDELGLARDGGVVEISTDLGETWTPISPIGGYPTEFTTSANSCGFPAGRGTFSGSSLEEWTQWDFDLSAWNGGPPVVLRFVSSTDDETTLEGWFLDDLVVTHAQVQGSCEPAIFVDGFESGGTGAWSGVAP